MIYEELKGKNVLVTGSSSGIGAATARLFAEHSCFVGVHYFQSGNDGEKVFNEVRKISDGCLLKADVRDEGQVDKMVDQFVSQAGGLDILVNNAGNLIKRMSIEKSDSEYYDDIFDTNLRSVVSVTRKSLGELKKGPGVIINIGSMAGHYGGSAGSGLYATAKAAVATVTISMAREFGAYGIRVNSVIPGLIETPFHERYSSPERVKAVAEQTPLRRNGTAEDIAKAILFLASDSASFITGEYIAVNGGYHMRV